MINKLEVDIWGMHVGTLIAFKDKFREKYSFYFDENFLKTGLDLSPLRASVRNAGIRNGMPIFGESEKSMAGLPAFIADSLPDSWGSRLFAEWASSKGIRKKDISSLDRLAYIGSRGMGGLEFRPPYAGEMENPFRIKIEQLYEVARIAMTEAYSTKLRMLPEILVHSLFRVGTSAGGKRPKAVINVNPATLDIYSGQVEAPEEGFIPMIIKFDEGEKIPSTRIEYAYYLMAKESGLDMMPSQLLTKGNIAHFLTERFDRVNNEKLHVQTFAAMSEWSDSYENLFEVATKLNLGKRDTDQIFLNTVLNVLGGNVDDHNKNFSFTMNRDGVWHFAPSYDFTFAIDVSMPPYMNRHSLTLNGKNDEITRKDLLELASKFNIKSPEHIIGKAVGALEKFEIFAREASLPTNWIKLISEEISNRLQLL